MSNLNYFNVNEVKRMKDIPGFEGKYAATSCGRIWSHLTKQFLKPHISHDGYR